MKTLLIMLFLVSCSQDNKKQSKIPVFQNAKKTLMDGSGTDSLSGNSSDNGATDSGQYGDDDFNDDGSATNTTSGNNQEDQTGTGTETDPTQPEVSKEDWFNLSPQDGAQGIGVLRAMEKLSAPTREIIVAVIDSGIDVNHEDLQGKIWINKKEILDNGIDDDKNGYIDDIMGWNFLGTSQGRATFFTDTSNLNGLRFARGLERFQINKETLEVTREMARLKRKVENDFDSFTEADQLYYNKLGTYYKSERDYIKNLLEKYKCNTSEPSPRCPSVVAYTETMLNYYLNFDYVHPLRELLNQEKKEFKAGYGNNDIQGPDASHGTHVAGIIAATRDNNLGINGIAQNVKIMVLRAVPDGDEYDEDIAMSIRYAVDNGASIINMSFGKAFSADQKIVQKAIKYAKRKGVVLVHAAGNDAKEIDGTNNYPHKKIGRKVMSNYLSVGANTKKADKTLVATFSNYSKSFVDLYAPGHKIESTTPDNQYAAYSGTSMAAPVASGAIAFLMSHFEDLDAIKAKDILLETVTDFTDQEIGSPFNKLFQEMSETSGVLNLEAAVEKLLN